MVEELREKIEEEVRRRRPGAGGGRGVATSLRPEETTGTAGLWRGQCLSVSTQAARSRTGAQLFGLSPGARPRDNAAARPSRAGSSSRVNKQPKPRRPPPFPADHGGEEPHALPPGAAPPRLSAGTPPLLLPPPRAAHRTLRIRLPARPRPGPSSRRWRPSRSSTRSFRSRSTTTSSGSSARCAEEVSSACLAGVGAPHHWMPFQVSAQKHASSGTALARASVT